MMQCSTQLFARPNTIQNDIQHNDFAFNHHHHDRHDEKEDNDQRQRQFQLQSQQSAINDAHSSDNEDEGMNIIESEDIPVLEGGTGSFSSDASSLHEHSWQRKQLDDLYASIRIGAVWDYVSENPEGLLTPLLRYQKQALSWMLSRENGKNNEALKEALIRRKDNDIKIESTSSLSATLDTGSAIPDNLYNSNGNTFDDRKIHEILDSRSFKAPGGILAEMMGLGKTIETISLILANPYNPSHSTDADAESIPEVVAENSNSTLVKPREVIYIDIDDEEIMDTQNESNRIYENKVENCMDRAHTPQLDPTEHSKLHPDNGAIASLSYISSYSQSIRNNSSDNITSLLKINCQLAKIKATLIVTPLSILHQWQNEISMHAPGLQVLVYIDTFLGSKLGKRKSRSSSIPEFNLVTASDLGKYDVVITTYSVLAHHIFYTGTQRTLRYAKVHAVPQSPLLSVHWHRFIVDEAQRVRNSTGNISRMSNKISSTYRWCVTGTPIGPNGLNDLFGLVTFIGCFLPEEYSLWRNWMNIDTENNSRLKNLQHLLRCIMWRQSKQDVQDELRIPPLHIETVYLNFSVVELEYYRRLEHEVSDKISTVSQTPTKNKYSKRNNSELLAKNQLELLRQACCNPTIGSLFSSLVSSDLSTQTNISAETRRSSSRRVLTMAEVAAKLLQKVREDATKKERDLCRAINRLAILERRNGQEESAQAHFNEAWTILDAGIVHVASLGNKNNDLGIMGDSSTADIVTANSQIRQWRCIEILTLFHQKEMISEELIKLREKLRESSCMNDAPIILAGPLNEVLESSSSVSATSVEDEINSLEQNHERISKRLEHCIDDILEVDLSRLEVMEKTLNLNEQSVRAHLHYASDSLKPFLNSRISLGRDEFYGSKLFRAIVDKLQAIRPRSNYLRATLAIRDKKDALYFLKDLVSQRDANIDILRIKHAMHDELLKSSTTFSREAAVLFTEKLKAQYDTLLNYFNREFSQYKDKHEKNINAHNAANLDLDTLRLRMEFNEHIGSLNIITSIREDEKVWRRYKGLQKQISEQRAYLLQECISATGNEDIDIDFESLKELKKNNKNRTTPRKDKERKQQENPFESQCISLQAGIESLRSDSLESYRHLQFLNLKFEELLKKTNTSVGHDSSNTHLEANHTTTLSPASMASTREDDQPEQEGPHFCPICQYNVFNAVITVCGHIFCNKCLSDWLKRKRPTRETPCPSCFHPLTNDDVVVLPASATMNPQTSAIHQDSTSSAVAMVVETKEEHDSTAKPIIVSADNQSFRNFDNLDQHDSPAKDYQHKPGMILPPLTEVQHLSIVGAGLYGTKVDTIARYLLYLHLHAPAIKSLVFSQFDKMLEIIGSVLKLNSIPYLHLKGNSNSIPDQLHSFHSSPHMNVLLLSMRRDNSGLTLVTSSHVFLVEPALERSAELQAINRVHRIGQMLPCFVYKFVMKRSIEEKIQQAIYERSRPKKLEKESHNEIIINDEIEDVDTTEQINMGIGLNADQAKEKYDMNAMLTLLGIENVTERMQPQLKRQKVF